MPKRVIDFDALWASDKLAACPEWAQPEYAWLYGLADASGSFELTNLRVIWGRVAAIRPSFTLERLTAIFDEFAAHGLLFTWSQGGKRYGHWTGSDMPGRLPPPSWRMRLERLAPPVPRAELAAYMAQFRLGEAATRTEAVDCADESGPGLSRLNEGLESGQTQEWVRERNGRREEKHMARRSQSLIHEAEEGSDAGDSPAALVQVFNEERGALPEAQMTAEVRGDCWRRIRHGLTATEFRLAVRRAAATPFLAGSGARGWCVTFDWLVAKDDNVRKVLSGRYEQHVTQRPLPEASVGTAPVAAAFGARVNPAALERIRAREAFAAAASAAGTVSSQAGNTTADSERASRPLGEQQEPMQEPMQEPQTQEPLQKGVA